MKKHNYLKNNLLQIFLFTLTVVLVYSCTKSEDDILDAGLTTQNESKQELSPTEVYELVADVTDEFALKDIEKMMDSSLEKNGNCLCFNSADLTDFLPCWGQSDMSCLCYDFNDDGTINSADLSVLLGNFGACSNDVMNIDIVPAYLNYNQDICCPGSALPEFHYTQNSTCTWDDVKANCCVEWIQNGVVISTEKGNLGLADAINNYGAFDCQVYQELTIRITHNPSGRIFERTDCGFYVNHLLTGSANDLPACGDEGCNAKTFEFINNAPVDPLEYCINCN